MKFWLTFGQSGSRKKMLRERAKEQNQILAQRSLRPEQQLPLAERARGVQVVMLVSVFVLMLMLAAILLFSFALINSSQSTKSSSDDSHRVQANSSSYLTISPSISSPTPPSSLFAFSISSTAPLKSDKWVRLITNFIMAAKLNSSESAASQRTWMPLLPLTSDKQTEPKGATH